MRNFGIKKALRLGLGAAMVFAGIAHLTFKRKEFQAQVPRWLPSHPKVMDFTVISSGFVEIALGLSLALWKEKRISTGLLLAIFYVLIFPGNISQFRNKIDAFGLDSDAKRFIRLLFQPILIYAALWSTGANQYLATQCSCNKQLPSI